jgi:hypothetical protein
VKAWDLPAEWAEGESAALVGPGTLWAEVAAAVAATGERFRGRYRVGHFDYEQPARLQPGVPRRFRKPYATPVAYLDWGPRDAPLLVCCGGVANVAMRFSFLAEALSRDHRVV